MMSRKKYIVGAVVLLIALGGGFLGGMEYKAYQVRSALQSAFGGTGEVEAADDEERTDDASSNDFADKVPMEITKKGFYKGDFQEQITFTLKFTNNTEKDISGVQGDLMFRDIFGNPINTIKITYSEDIKVGENKLYNAGLDYNQFMTEHQKLNNTDLEKLRYEWVPNKIVYADGTEEEL